MQTPPYSLSPSAQQLLDYLLTTTKGLQLPRHSHWIAHVDTLDSSIIFTPRQHQDIKFEMDYTLGVAALLELVQARKVQMDGFTDTEWTFLLTP